MLVLPELIIFNVQLFVLDLKAVLSIVGLNACCDLQSAFFIAR